jgi:selenide,water dikinase
VCSTAGIPVAGGHSIDNAEPIYGLVALGLVHPDQLLRNSGGKAGDVLILSKPLGIGVYSAALKKGQLGPDEYRAMIASTTQLNTLGRDLAGIEGVHAVTDVTGFGLLGHALEMARGAGLLAEIAADSAPLHPGVEALARSGVRTGAAARNWSSFCDAVELPEGFPEWRRDLLCDPQTSGGLLIAVAPEAAGRVLTLARAKGFTSTAAVGRLVDGPPSARVR